jgi:ABC-2 type transport system permease protein
MNLGRIAVLLKKEFFQGPKNFIFLMALVVPVVLTLLVSLIFGSFFSGKARLGIADEGSSQLTEIVSADPSMRVSIYPSAEALKEAVGRGAADLGLLLPAGFDQDVGANQVAKITVFVWGESQMQHRLIATSALIQATRQIAGQQSPVEVSQVVLGQGGSIPWEQRLMPLIVLMTLLMGGTMVPSTSIVSEKSRKTLSALAVSPATLLDVFIAKGLLGAILVVFSGFLVLFLNRALGDQPLLLLSVLVLASIFSASIGVILGALVKDINTLFTTVKSLGIFLYAPGVVSMFPEIPQWIGRVFPTYYVLNPVMRITQDGAGLPEIAGELAILVGLTLVSFILIVRLADRTREAAALT